MKNVPLTPLSLQRTHYVVDLATSSQGFLLRRLFCLVSLSLSLSRQSSKLTHLPLFLSPAPSWAGDDVDKGEHGHANPGPAAELSADRNILHGVPSSDFQPGRCGAEHAATLPPVIPRNASPRRSSRGTGEDSSTFSCSLPTSPGSLTSESPCISSKSARSPSLCKLRHPHLGGGRRRRGQHPLHIRPNDCRERDVPGSSPHDTVRWLYARAICCALWPACISLIFGPSLQVLHSSVVLFAALMSRFILGKEVMVHLPCLPHHSKTSAHALLLPRS